jgi:putative oxidoreductase
MGLLILRWVCILLLAAVFLYSGYSKMQSTLQFAAVLAQYQLVPTGLVLPLATYLPWAEIVLGLFLLTGWKTRFAAWAAAALLSVFIAAMTVTYFRGIEADCGCFGIGEKISPGTIGRDALLLLPAAFLLAERRIRRRAE